MTEPTESILEDDAELRRAIKRVRGGHVADDALRSRIEQTLESAATATPAAPAAHPSRWQRWAPRLAIAACLIIAGGTLEHVRHKAGERTQYAAANDVLLQSMVTAHRQPPDETELPKVDASREASQVRDELSRRLKRQAPTPDLRAAGWSLRSADIESLNGAVTARFSFANGPRSATLFSLPQFAFIGAEGGESYDVMVNGHPISGYITRDGVHCIVGDAGMPLSEITALRKSLQKASENSRAS